MADDDLKVVVKAKELAVHSFKLTSIGKGGNYMKRMDKIAITATVIGMVAAMAAGNTTPCWPTAF